MLSKIRVSPSPHISEDYSTRTVMLDVIIALVPAMLAAGYYFRHYAVTLILTCVIAAVVSEWICNLIMKRENSLRDLSAVVTGIILALSLPPSFPLWAAVIGSAFAIVIGKMVFGGLGSNIFNPAMASRAFLTASFGMLMTTWTVPATVNPEMPEISPDNATADVLTQATPLALSKDAVKTGSGARKVNQHLKPAFIGKVGGCLGETSALALIIGGIYLLFRRTITIHIPLSILLSIFVFASIGFLADPSTYISPVMHLNIGGVWLCAFFIATCPVTSPLTAKGKWIFGVGIGAMIMLIRIVGEYPGAVMYSVLFMNSLTPLIDRFCKLTPAGGKPNE
jgi:electron transport complex protein RnfD